MSNRAPKLNLNNIDELRDGFSTSIVVEDDGVTRIIKTVSISKNLPRKLICLYSVYKDDELIGNFSSLAEAKNYGKDNNLWKLHKN
jgi:hypothetical protein